MKVQQNFSNFDIEVMERLERTVDANTSREQVEQFVQEGELSRTIGMFRGLYELKHTEKASKVAMMVVKLCKILQKIFQDDPHHERDIWSKVHESYHMIVEGSFSIFNEAMEKHQNVLSTYILKIFEIISQFNEQLHNEISSQFNFGNIFFLRALEIKKVGSKKPKQEQRLKEGVINFLIMILSVGRLRTRENIMSTNVKTMKTLWKNLDKIVAVDVIDRILGFVENKILDEEGLSKSMKCQILSNGFMDRILVLNNSFDENKELSKKVIKLILKITTNFEKGLCYLNNDFLTNNNMGVEIIVNKKKFRVRNKLIYNFLVKIKLNDSYDNISIITEILKRNLELVTPYLNFLVQNGGYNDPSLTMWWISRTLFFSNILQIPFPKAILSQDEDKTFKKQINCKLASENIVLAPITKSALTKTLTTDKPLIIQLGLQLIFFIIKKLISILISDLMVNKRELINLVFNNLPDIKTITNIYSSMIERPNIKKNFKMIKITLILIIKEYNALLSYKDSFALSIFKLSNSELKSLLSCKIEKFTKINLVLLDIFLSIHLNYQQLKILKWWNKDVNGNSLFIYLLKLSVLLNLNVTLDKRIQNLLTLFIDKKYFFKQDLKVSPILILITSLKDIELKEDVWNLLDECISKAVSNFYFYLDLSHQKYDDVSVFILIIFDQLKYFSKLTDFDCITNWILRLSRFFIISGEAKNIVMQLFEDYFDNNLKTIAKINNINLSKSLDFLTFDSVDSLESNAFINIITKFPLSNNVQKLKHYRKKKLLNEFEFFTLIHILISVINNKQIKSDSEDFIFLITLFIDTLKIELENKNKNLHKIFTIDVWTKLLFMFLDKNVTVISLKKQLLKNYNSFLLNFFNSNFELISNFQEIDNFRNALIREFDKDNSKFNLDDSLNKFLWMLKNDQIRDILKKNLKDENLIIETLKIASFRQVNINDQILINLLNYNKNKINFLLVEFFEKNSVFIEHKDFSFIKKIILNPSNYLFLNYIFSTPIDKKEIHLLVDYVESQKKNHFLTLNLGTVLKQKNLIDDNKIILFFEKLLDHFFLSSKNGLFDDRNTFEQLIRMFNNAFDFVSESHKKKIFNFFVQLDQKNENDFILFPEFLCLMMKIMRTGKIEDNKLHYWIDKFFLYLSQKVFDSFNPSKKFTIILSHLKSMFTYIISTKKTIDKLFSLKNLNEHIFGFLQNEHCVIDEDCLDYVNFIVCIFKNNVDSMKMIQIFLNNPRNVLIDSISKKKQNLRFLSSLLIFNLYMLDPNKNSTISLLEKLITFYLGSVFLEDQLIKHILYSIEKVLQKSWIQDILHWNFVYDGIHDNFKTISNLNSSYKITFFKRFISNTIKNITLSSDNKFVKDIVDLNNDFLERTNVFKKIHDERKIKLDYSADLLVYDLEFIILLLINNTDLFKIEKLNGTTKEIKVNLTMLIELEILSLIISSLASHVLEIKKLAKNILSSILNSIQHQQLKNKNILTVYMMNIFNTLKKNQNDICILIWVMYSYLSKIIINPKHFLYLKSCHYVLTNPLLNKNSIPLYTLITTSYINIGKINSDVSYYKEISWLISTLTSTLNDEKSLFILKKNNGIEFFLNFLNSYYLSKKIKHQILYMIYSFQKIFNGAGILLSRSGSLSTMDILYNWFSFVSNDTNNPDDKLMLANIKSILHRFIIIISFSKRLKNWFFDDLSFYLKIFSLNDS